MSIENDLSELKSTDTLVSFKRNIDPDEEMTGFVIDYSFSLLLLELVDENFLKIGFSVISLDDITLYQIHNGKESFVGLVQSKLGLYKSELKLNLQSFAHVLEQIHAITPLIGIYEEKTNPYLSVGVICGMNKCQYDLLEIDTDAEWVSTVNHKISNITQVVFLNGYLQALWLIGKDEIEDYILTNKEKSLMNIVRDNTKEWCEK